MKTTEDDLIMLREYAVESHVDEPDYVMWRRRRTFALLDDLYEALASAAAWQAKCERAEARAKRAETTLSGVVSCLANIDSILERDTFAENATSRPDDAESETKEGP